MSVLQLEYNTTVYSYTQVSVHIGVEIGSTTKRRRRMNFVRGGIDKHLIIPGEINFLTVREQLRRSVDRSSQLPYLVGNVH